MYLQVRDIVNGIGDIERIDNSCVDVIWRSRLLGWVLCIVETEIGRRLISSTIRIAFMVDMTLFPLSAHGGVKIITTHAVLVPLPNLSLCQPNELVITF